MDNQSNQSCLAERVKLRIKYWSLEHAKNKKTPFWGTVCDHHAHRAVMFTFHMTLRARFSRVTVPPELGSAGSQVLRARVSMVTGPPSSGQQGHRSTELGSAGSQVLRARVSRVTGPPSSGQQGHRSSELGSAGSQVLRARVSRVTGPPSSGSAGSQVL